MPSKYNNNDHHAEPVLKYCCCLVVRGTTVHTWYDTEPEALRRSMLNAVERFIRRD